MKKEKTWTPIRLLMQCTMIMFDGTERNGIEWNSMQKKDDSTPPDKNRNVLKLDSAFHYMKKMAQIKYGD